jgi:uncharacterized protein YlaN (UPF0358 family)
MEEENGKDGRIEEIGKKEKNGKEHMMRAETESQINKSTIPTLIPLNSLEIINNVLNNNRDYIDEYLTDIGYVEYFVDQFEDTLPKDSPKLELLDNDFYKLKREVDYIAFLSNIFKENGSSVLLFNLGTDFSDIEICIDKIERLDKIDQYIILNLHKTYVESETYAITDKTLFEFFIRGFLREAISGTLFFEKLEIFLSYGYDMSLPIFFKDINQIDKFKNKAKKLNIYLRIKED